MSKTIVMRYFAIGVTLFLFISAIYNNNVNAADSNWGRIIGYVRDAKTGKPINYANVFLNNTTLGTVTNSEGYFQINKIPAGNYALVVTMMGYRPLKVNNVSILEKKIRVVGLKLNQQIIELGGVKVTADKATQLTKYEMSFVGHELVTPQATISKAGSLEDAYRAMATLPSVVTRNDLNTQLYIRGGSPDQNLVIYDGVEIFNPSRLFVVMGGGISLVNPDIIEAIDLAPGGFDVEYGNKMSALMKISTRDGRRDRVAVKSSTSLVSVRAVAEGPIAHGRGSWLIAGRRSFYDMLANNFYSQNYVFPYFFDMNGKFSYRFSPDKQVRVFYSHLGEGAQMYNVESESLDLINRGNGDIAGVNFDAILSKKLAFKSHFGYYSDYNNTNIYDTYNYSFHAKLKYGVKRWSSGADIHFYPFSWLFFKTGAKVQANNNDVNWDIAWRNYIELPTQINFNAQYMHNSAYWQTRLRFLKQVEYSMGLRYDYSTLYNQAQWNPRTKIIYSPVPGVRLWASSGLYSQFPDLMTIISRGEPMDITQRSENLKAEKAVHNILGFDWDMTENSYLKVEIYNRKISDLLVADEDSYLAENMGEGLANGIEFTLQNSGHLFLPYNFWANYSYSVAQYKRQDELHWTYLDFDQRHQSAAGLECDISDNWSIGSVFRYGSGFPYTPVDGLQKDISTHGALDGWQIIKGAKNSRRYPIYSRVDLRITYKHKGNSWDMSAYLDFMNVLNNKNVYLYEWDFTSNSNSGVSLAKKNVTYMLPFVPSFGLNFQF